MSSGLLNEKGEAQGDRGRVCMAYVPRVPCHALSPCPAPSKRATLPPSNGGPDGLRPFVPLPSYLPRSPALAGQVRKG